MLRTVADETPNPGTVTRSEDATGSPEAMYSRMSAAKTRFDRSWVSWDIIQSDDPHVSSLTRGLLINYTPARLAISRAAARASATISARSTWDGAKSSTSTSPSTIVVRTSLPRPAYTSVEYGSVPGTRCGPSRST